jgi:hypothetical protein
MERRINSGIFSVNLILSIWWVLFWFCCSLFSLVLVFCFLFFQKETAKNPIFDESFQNSNFLPQLTTNKQRTEQSKKIQLYNCAKIFNNWCWRYFFFKLANTKNKFHQFIKWIGSILWNHFCEIVISQEQPPLWYLWNCSRMLLVPM